MILLFFSFLIMMDSLLSSPALIGHSAQTKKLVKTYAKEGYRQAAYYTKRGVRSAARGLTIAAAVYSKFDVAGS